MSLGCVLVSLGQNSAVAPGSVTGFEGASCSLEKLRELIVTAVLAATHLRWVLLSGPPGALEEKNVRDRAVLWALSSLVGRPGVHHLICGSQLLLPEESKF